MVKISVKLCSSFLKILFILANSIDPDEMPPYASLHLGLHCLSKYLFITIQNEELMRLKRIGPRIHTATYTSCINLPYVVHKIAMSKLANTNGNDRQSVFFVLITSD